MPVPVSVVYVWLLINEAQILTNQRVTESRHVDDVSMMITRLQFDRHIFIKLFTSDVSNTINNTDDDLP